jgi:hypothetical protein
MYTVIESPFRPSDDDVRRYQGTYSRAELLRQNIIFARLAVADSLARGEHPIASHLLYTQVWSETPELREAGIRAGVRWHARSDKVILYIDLGLSQGMRNAEDNALLVGCERGRRLLFPASAVDPRVRLAAMRLQSFPYLEELQAEENASGTMRVAADLRVVEPIEGVRK